MPDQQPEPPEWKVVAHRYETGEELHFEYRVAGRDQNGRPIVTEVRNVHLHGNWEAPDGPDEFVVRHVLGKCLDLTTLKPQP